MVNTITMANAGVPVTARRCDLYEKALKGSDELLFDPDDPSQKMTPDRFATVAQGLHLVLWERFNAVSSAVSDPRYMAVAKGSKLHAHSDTLRHPLFGRFVCDCRNDAHHSSCEHVLAVRGMDTWKPHHVDILTLVQAHSVRPRPGRPHNVTPARVKQPHSPVAAEKSSPTANAKANAAATIARPSAAAAGEQLRGFGRKAEQPANKAAKGSAPFPGTRGGEQVDYAAEGSCKLWLTGGPWPTEGVVDAFLFFHFIAFFLVMLCYRDFYLCCILSPLLGAPHPHRDDRTIPGRLVASSH